MVWGLLLKMGWAFNPNNMAAEILFVKGSELPKVDSVSTTDYFIMVVNGKTSTFTYERLVAAINTGGTTTGHQIEVLEFTINDGDTVVLPARTRLMEITLISVTGQTVRVGTSAGNDEVIEDILLAPNKANVNAFGDYFMSETTLHFTCPSAMTVEIIKYSKT